MTITSRAPAGYVLGDGTTALAKAASRWKQWGWLVWTLAAILLTVGLSAIIRLPQDTDELSIYSHTDFGASATGNILRDHGIDIEQVSTLADAATKLREGDTLVIARYTYFDSIQVASIMLWDGPIVWIDPNFAEIVDVNDALETRSTRIYDRRNVDCDAAEAIRARGVSAGGPGRDIGKYWNALQTGVSVCFRDSNTDAGLYVRMDRGHRGPVHLIATANIVNNQGLIDDGNAALTFNTIGGSDHVVWYTGDYDYTTLRADSKVSQDYITPTTPSWLTPAIFMGTFIGLVGVLWRGRRMGKVITERLPVVVRASEATRGRARLYRRQRSYGHATAALRAGAIMRMAKRLGLSRTADHSTVIGAVVAATGRRADEVDAILYGPPPSDNASIMDTVARLDRLEREVHDS